MSWILTMFHPTIRLADGLLDDWSRAKTDDEIGLHWMEELRERLWLQLLLHDVPLAQWSDLYEHCSEERSRQLYIEFMRTSNWRIITRLRDPPQISAKSLLMFYFHALLD